MTVETGPAGGGGGRWMAVGTSVAADSFDAGRAATLAALTGAEPKLLLVFAGIGHDPRRLVDGIRDAAPGVPMIGCSTHGEIDAGGPRDGSVVVTALGGGFSVSTTAVAEISGRQREAGAEAARCVAAVDELPHRVLVLLTDGLARDQESVIRGAYGLLGAGVPLFGGAAGDGWRMSGTFQLHGDDVHSNGVVAACIASAAPIAIGIDHGWRPAGEPMVVTQSGDGRVQELDDAPALDTYLDRLGAPADVYQDETALRHYVLSRPLGVQRRSGIEVRNLSTAVDVDGRTIGGGGDLSLGALTFAMEGDEESVVTASARACRSAIEQLDGRTPVGLLTLSCAACRAVLGDAGVVKEGERIAEQAGDIPFAGFYTYGEIARTRGINGFHNQTMVVLAFG
ncbi:FIST N-terminal domain-containing protein [Dactylosporangium sp. NPDC049742]|uniref:FIST signal transduction protein n=1 Tax=Dactylosporangium sp. NPDC049742 TaxID=3154737 RepID=UPI0034276AA3